MFEDSCIDDVEHPVAAPRPVAPPRPATKAVPQPKIAVTPTKEAAPPGVAPKTPPKGEAVVVFDVGGSLSISPGSGCAGLVTWQVFPRRNDRGNTF